ncbi:prenyltransferase/squalene oxidase repeat-containing protein [Micromonospora inositola]|uniref:Squalene-hopene cyclase C-terminal domain-containing protein n=1 Tax=Micromonospora inositola TaxID=47865 RepID=A0A1C5J1Q4_9ACTN|nr:prenyltransferase/squalene oxidase repeat-containing protein [Micromonospora inositola]SCG64537.1 Squalene-hopene cyclase C-terminal domain-containing protein [Micromonospora inositola]
MTDAAPLDVAPDTGHEEAAARELIAAMMLAPNGQSSASVYETGRLVSLAPWLVRHAERIDHLLLTQAPTGGWGGPGGYALVPTLSAVEALLAALLRGDLRTPDDGEIHTRVVRALGPGLVRLRDLLAEPGLALPDLPAIDLVVPALVESLNGHLARVAAGGRAELRRGPYDGPLPLPAGMGRGRLERVREVLGSGDPVPEKIWHALEVGGPAARRATGAMVPGSGAVGASPAATAAWIGTPDDAAAPALSYLEETVRQYGGPVPPASPIAVFERAWVLSTLSRSGVPFPVPPRMLASLADALGPAGTPTGPGLPPDADTTSVTLSALARLGRPVPPSSLWAYDTGEHFCTWHGEDGASVTTNAHVLDALGWHATRTPAEPRLASAVERLTAWLCARQGPDGAWSDRWHASPYYATCCAVLALAEYGRGVRRDDALDRAAAWLLEEQRPDGSWGRWTGTVEETAYALQALLSTTRPADPRPLPHLHHGYRYLSTMEGRDGEPALWHDKDLYRPPLIVGAAVTAARYLVRLRMGLHPPGYVAGGLISAA